MRNGSRMVVVAGLAIVVLTVAVARAAQPAAARRGPERPSSRSDEALVARGAALFATGCSSCHGNDGRGVRLASGAERGPSLVNSGEAAAVYYLTTGRMPLANTGDVPVRKRPAYDPAEIRALVAYVAGLGSGPSLPDPVADPDLPVGGELFRANCQACHSATGAGGALSYGRNAPPLDQSTRVQVGAAMRAGPGQMPTFGRSAFTDRDVADIADYVQYLRKPDDRGGVALGRLGPVPEGLFVWTVGIGSLLVAAVWIGGRAVRTGPKGAAGRSSGDLVDEMGEQP